MTEHFDDRSLIEFIRKQASELLTKQIEKHLETCGVCYRQYIDLVKHEHERKEVPTAEFLHTILEKIESRNPGLRISAIIEGTKILFRDGMNNLLPSPALEPSLHPLAQDRLHGVFSAPLRGIDVIVLVSVRPDTTYSISVSVPKAPENTTVSMNKAGQDIETISIDQENQFSNSFRSGEYDIRIGRESGETIGDIQLTLP